MTGQPDWIRDGVDGATWGALTERLSSSQLWSLLLAVVGKRAERRRPADLMRQWQRDGITRPAPVDQRVLIELDAHLLCAASGFEALELSPVAPLGSCSATALASQNKILSALRGTELVADPTNVLALECARRLQRKPDATVRLATSHRCIRTQPFPDVPGFTRHFRLFVLATAARERRDHAARTEALAEHIRTHLAAIDRLEAHGYAFGDRRLRVLATPEHAELGDRVAAMVGGAVERALLEHDYYHGLRFTIEVGGARERVLLSDGGTFDWVAKLASNRRLVYVASGLGAQLAAYRFRR